MGITTENVARMERGQRNPTLRSTERQGDAIGLESVLGLHNRDLFCDPAVFAALLASAPGGPGEG